MPTEMSDMCSSLRCAKQPGRSLEILARSALSTISGFLRQPRRARRLDRRP
jgi:hypothetical protein